MGLPFVARVSEAHPGPVTPDPGALRYPGYESFFLLSAEKDGFAGETHPTARPAHLSNFADNTIADVVRSTPSIAPMRSVSSSIAATDGATPSATRSNGPLT